MKRVALIVLCLAVLGSSFGCSGGGGGTGSKKPHQAKMAQLTKTPEMENNFQQAEKLYFARKLSEAKAAYEAYLKQYPYNALTPKATFRLGEIAFSEKDDDRAISYYRKARAKGVDPDWGAYAIYKEAVCFSRKEDGKKVLSTLDEIPADSHDRKAGVRAGSLRVTTAKKLENPLEEKRGYLELIDAYEGFRPDESRVGDLNWIVDEKTAKDEIRQWIAAEEANASDVGRLKGWYENRFDGKTSGGYLTWKITRVYDQKGDYKNAAEWAKRYIQIYSKGEYMSAASALLAQIDKRGGTEPVSSSPQEGRAVVGVLLPLTGKYAVYGESVLHGLECGAGIFTPCRGDLGVNLVVRDTQGDPHMAEKIVVELAKNQDVRAVIGPLPQVEVDQAAAVAEMTSLPMISLSQKADVAKLGQYVFRNFLTVADQVASVVGYACGSKKWKKLAILYPAGPTGEEYKKAFEEEVRRCNGKLVAQASYPPEAKNLTDAIRSLKAPGGEQAVQGTEVKAPFDALFVPDVYRRIPEVVAALQFLGIEGVHLLGGAGWDSPGLLQGGADKLEGAVFVDGFFAKSTNFATRDFVSTFQSAYGVEPTLLEAYAFDTLRLMGEVLRDNPSATREDIQKALAKKRGFSGVTGNISFDDDGDARRRLTVLTVEQGEIREVR